MTVRTVSRFDLHQQTLEYLEAAGAEAGVLVFVGFPENVPWKTDRSGVKKYVVLFPTAGRAAAGGEDLAGSAENLDWGIQLLVAGATENDVLFTYDWLDRTLKRWSPPGLVGINTDGFRAPDGYDPGPVRVFDQVKPARRELPAQYRLIATT